MDVISVLRNIPVFQGLSDNEYSKIIPLLDHVTYPAGALIMREGTTGSSMYILLSGSVKVWKMVDEEEIVISVLSSGSYFGELSLLDNLPRSANVQSLEDTVLFHLKKNDFDSLLKHNIKIANVFYKNCISETFSRFRNIIKNFTFSQHILKETTESLEEINKDLSLAKELQHCFINTAVLDNEDSEPLGIKHSYVYQPCIDVGGDFLNMIKLPNNSIGIIIADVVGHGVTSAMATGILKSGFSFYEKKYAGEPAVMMSKLNNHYFEIMSKYYATCYYSLINVEEGTMTVAKGGHHHPLLWKKNLSDFFEIECGGIGIGIINNAKYEQTTIQIEPGDKIFFFTDGIVEQRNSDKIMYSDERLKQVFKNSILANSTNILDDIVNDFKSFTGNMKYEDDVTLLLIEI